MYVISRFDCFAQAHHGKPAFIFFSPDKGWKTIAYQQLADAT
jgi:hypothetical protein